MKRFVFIPGGVEPSHGKGLAAESLGSLLQRRGYRVRLRKLDPYLHFDRFTGVLARASDPVSAGRIYWTVLTRERHGDYLGGTVQVIPHVTNAIKEFILSDTEDADIVLCEIGGTVGDIEGLPFLEAIRQLGNELPRGHSVFIHLTLVPFIACAGEMKTKPTQHSVKELRS